MRKINVTQRDDLFKENIGHSDNFEIFAIALIEGNTSYVSRYITEAKYNDNLVDINEKNEGLFCKVLLRYGFNSLVIEIYEKGSTAGLDFILQEIKNVYIDYYTVKRLLELGADPDPEPYILRSKPQKQYELLEKYGKKENYLFKGDSDYNYLIDILNSISGSTVFITISKGLYDTAYLLIYYAADIYYHFGTPQVISDLVPLGLTELIELVCGILYEDNYPQEYPISLDPEDDRITTIPLQSLELYMNKKIKFNEWISMNKISLEYDHKKVALNTRISKFIDDEFGIENRKSISLIQFIIEKYKENQLTIYDVDNILGVFLNYKDFLNEENRKVHLPNSMILILSPENVLNLMDLDFSCEEIDKKMLELMFKKDRRIYNKIKENVI